MLSGWSMTDSGNQVSGLLAILPQCMGSSKRPRVLLRKIILGVMKNNTQWFWCQTISIHQAFYIEAMYFDCHYYTSINIVI